MATITGASGALLYNGVKVAKVRQFDLQVNRDALENTCIGQRSRSFIPGLIGASGSATIMFDRNDGQASALLNSIFTESDMDATAAIGGFRFIFDEISGKRIEADGLLTSVSASVAVGDIQTAQVSIQLTGNITGSF